MDNIKKSKVIFFAVDCQKDFMNKDGALYIEGSENIKHNLKKLTDFARKKNILIVNTRDCHKEGDLEISKNPDFINTFPEHCMEGTGGASFIQEISPYIDGQYVDISTIYNNRYSPGIDLDSKSIIIEKNKFDVFEGNPHTSKLLEFINPDSIFVYGVATNVCVHKAVVGLLNRGYEVCVVEDAIKEIPHMPLDNIYKEWQDKGVIWASTEGVLNYRV